ncbi:MAG: Na(+)/H(+)-K(+) antiporter GerN [Phycisphaerae bacterium]|nr:Na(+)/H(+)-K(+) antiporter GerN [Phycisphaerae bacterium]
MSNFQTSIHVFLQLCVILTVCRVVGTIGRRLGQSQVVGEMIAGVVLGPSLFGYLAPDAHAWLFPPKSPTMTVLYCAAQLGLVLYMFLVGAEFHVALLGRQARAAAVISISGMLVPFVLGGGFGLLMAGDASLFGAGVGALEAALFMGAAMSITAFPMLARIIHEQGLTGTMLGTLALAAGSMDDAAAWCVLALVLASFSGDGWIAVKAIAGGIAYAVITLTILRYWLRPLGERSDRLGTLSPTAFTFLLALLFAASWYTDWVGIYAVFGAFILGVAVPRGVVTRELVRRIEPLTSSVLLPLFFVYSGLNTRIDLVDSPRLWLIAAVVLLAACVGKLAACGVAAWRCGQSPRDAFAVGALMNARGLMELIILNIGLERGVIRAPLFSVMVMMAIVTTLMATPLFALADTRRMRPMADLAAPAPGS